MEWIIIPLVILAVIVALLFALKWIYNKLTDRGELLPYKLNENILTDRELEFYKKLKPIADELDLVICPKVRLADIVSVHNAGKDRQKYFNKIQSKHVDFALCDQDMKFKLLVELDDSTHQRADRQKSDEFKNLLFKHVQLPLIRVNSIKNDLKQAINTALQPPISTS